MGSKTEARKLAIAAGVPVVPGTEQGVSRLDEALAIAARIGYPVMLKAAAGGGGKGMRRVDAPVRTRISPSRCVERSRTRLQERRSLPREVPGAPAPRRDPGARRPARPPDPPRRARVLHPAAAPEGDRGVPVAGDAAVAAPAAGDGRGGGQSRARRRLLQRRHGRVPGRPAGQLLLPRDEHAAAGGAPRHRTGDRPRPRALAVAYRRRRAAALRLRQDIRWRGCALECRIYAEDPDNQFFPSPGRITRIYRPVGPGIRLDSGAYSGWTVPMDYDPLLAKMAVWAEDRPGAIARMLRALREYSVSGIKTNVSFFRGIFDDAALSRRRPAHRLHRRVLRPQTRTRPGRPRAEVAAALVALLHTRQQQSAPVR